MTSGVELAMRILLGNGLWLAVGLYPELGLQSPRLEGQADEALGVRPQRRQLLTPKEADVARLVPVGAGLTAGDPAGENGTHRVKPVAIGELHAVPTAGCQQPLRL